MGTDVLCTGGTAPVAPTINPAGVNFLDDSRWDNIYLPFTFNYFGVDYYQVNICTNGWMGLGGTNTGLTGFNVSIPNVNPANNVVFGMLSDLTFRGATGGTIEYYTSGIAPNRKFIVLFSGIHFLSGGGTGDMAIVLFETTNVIEIHTSVVTNTMQLKTQGIENSGGTVGVAATGKNNVANWGASTSGFRFTPETISYSWSPSIGLSTTTGQTVTATPASTTTYTVTATNSVSATATNTVTVSINNGSYTLAGTPGGATISQNISVVPTGTYYRDISNCNLIAYIAPAGNNPVTNSINTILSVDTGSNKKGTSDLYAARKYDIEPIVSPSTSTANITLYYLQTEFNNFNLKASDSGHTKLPTGPADATGISNLIMRQFHGTGTNPNNYTGSSVDLSTANSGFTVLWNSTRSWWEITVPVSGFSGFYLTTKKTSALPISLEYFKGIQINRQNILSWKSSCNSIQLNFELERSNDGTHFNTITKIMAPPSACGFPIDYTDGNPLSGLNYYRLKIVEDDGKYMYSNIVSLMIKSKGFSLLSISPNLIHNENALLKINAGEKADMVMIITDFYGRQVDKQMIVLQPGINYFSINTALMATGAYQVTGYTSDQYSQTLRFIKQ